MELLKKKIKLAINKNGYRVKKKERIKCLNNRKRLLFFFVFAIFKKKMYYLRLFEFENVNQNNARHQ